MDKWPSGLRYNIWAITCIYTPGVRIPLYPIFLILNLIILLIYKGVIV